MRFEGYIITITDASVMFHAHWWEEPDFVPKSQIEEFIRYPDTTEVSIRISSWLCNKKGLEEFKYRRAINGNRS